MRKGIILGIGILISLLALAGTGSAKWEYDASCSVCHTGFPTPLTATGIFFNDTHKFDGVSKPSFGTSCVVCHVDPHNQTTSPNWSMTLAGRNYSTVHNGTNTYGYARNLVNCTYCHTSPNGGDFSFSSEGTIYGRVHKFDGVSIPNNATGCTYCHTDVRVFMPLTSKGPYYNDTHRYNSTILGSELLTSPGCGLCHVNATSANFTMLSGTATYLTSAVCKDCHKAKHDNWNNTMHRVILTRNTTAQAMNLILPPTYSWTANVSYAIIGKTNIYYLNETGYFKDKKYNTITMSNDSAVNYSGVNYSGQQYDCGACHSTGYNATGDNTSMPGIIGTWSEDGVGCESCHGAGGNGHNVAVDPTGQDCLQCHDGATRQGLAMENRHKTAPAEESTRSTCTFCHSPYDKYRTGAAASLSSAINVTCFVCHNPHNTSNDKYGNLLMPAGFNATAMSVEEDAKVSFFNGTASNASLVAAANASLTAGNDVYDTLTTPVSLFYGLSFKIGDSTVKDSSYGTGAINVTGPVSEVLCSMCHFRHGLAHIVNVSMTHGRNNPDTAEWGTCTDCHLAKAGGMLDHSFNARNTSNYPEKTCSKGTNCHVTSNQSLSASNLSLVPLENEWNASDHRATRWYSNSRTSTSCRNCHEPMGWDGSYTNTIIDSSLMPDITPKGIACAVCHNIHDMGSWINNTGKTYAWYNRSYSSSKANYEVMANTTELCGNCHSNDHPRIYRAGPGYNQTTDVTPIRPHGWPAKDVFMGSWKQSPTAMNFSCIDCHMYRNKTNGSGGIVNDSEKITGHSFTVNVTGLQNTSRCGGCHDGTNYATISSLIDEIQTRIQDKYNTTNDRVVSTISYVNTSSLSKNLSRDKLAQAYWKVRMVSSDGSWGVHDQVKTNQWLDEALTLADGANASLGTGNTTWQLYTGWNIRHLNETPAVTAPVSVMSSVISNVTVVWGLDASTQTWLLYDPARPDGLNTLTSMVKDESYEIKVTANCTWVV